MSLVIKHRESFAYGARAVWSQRYWTPVASSVVKAWEDVFENAQFLQWGRGNAPQGWAMRGNNYGIVALPFAQFGITPDHGGFGTGLAYNQGGFIGGSLIAEWYEIYDEAGHHVRHLSLQTNGSGQLIARAGGTAGQADGTTIGSPSTAIVPPGANSAVPPYSHLEIIPVIHPSAGSIQVKLEGVLVLNLSGAATVNAAQIALGNGVGIAHFNTVVAPISRTVTDWYTTNGDGWKGDRRVAYFPAAVAGTYTDGTAVGAGTKLACVSEVATDLDTTRIEIDDTGLPQSVSFTTTALPPETVAVDEVAPFAISRKDDAGPNTHRLGIRSDTTEDFGSVDVPTPTGHTPEERGYMHDPATDAPWEIAAADASETIYKRTA